MDLEKKWSYKILAWYNEHTDEQKKTDPALKATTGEALVHIQTLFIPLLDRLKELCGDTLPQSLQEGMERVPKNTNKLVGFLQPGQ